MKTSEVYHVMACDNEGDMVVNRHNLTKDIACAWADSALIAGATKVTIKVESVPACAPTRVKANLTP